MSPIVLDSVFGSSDDAADIEGMMVRGVKISIILDLARKTHGDFFDRIAVFL